MKHLGELRQEAREAAGARGHAIHWSAPWHGEHRSIQNGECDNCAAEVQIITKPDANETQIAGTAVALDCPVLDPIIDR